MPWGLKLGLALAAVYLAWGSSYLAVLIGVRDAPPLMFAGARLLLAAPLMLMLALSVGQRWPTERRSWVWLLVVATLIPAGSGGLVAWALQFVPSGHAAIIIASAALWMTWFASWGASGERVSMVTMMGLVLGLIGVALVMEGSWADRELRGMAGYVALVLASASLAAGTVLLRRHPPHCGIFMAAGLQMTLAGLVLVAMAALLGESPTMTAFTPHALGALIYLVVGSVLGYSALYWLVSAVSPALLGSYLYVSPAVAVLLGWWVLDERLSAVQGMGMVVILAAVVVVEGVTKKHRRQASGEEGTT